MGLIRTNPDKPVIYWLLTGCALIYILIVVGCLTRLTHSGLSITEWSFMGSVPPLNDEMWAERFAKYQESPEFKKVNYSMTLDEFKPIFMWEFVHRLIGRTMMMVFVAGFVLFLLQKRITAKMWPSFILLFLMGAMQAVIGWWMVYSGLRDKPAVSHYRLATHLLSAFMLFAFTFWFALRLIFAGTPQTKEQGRGLRGITIVFFIVLTIQIIYGAFTAGYVEGDAARIRPGHIFNTWPMMGDQWMADQVLMKGSLAENLLENASGIQFVHRTLALVVVILLCVLWYRSNKLNLSKHQHLGVTLLIYGVTVQFILGVMTLVYNVPVVLGVLHQSGAFFLFAGCVYLIFHLFRKPLTDLERNI